MIPVHPIKELGSVSIMPRTIYWFEIPSNFKDKDKIELLQKDIWIEPMQMEKIHDINEKDKPIFLINLDALIYQDRKIEAHEAYIQARNIVEKIKVKKSLKTVTHTTHINDKMKSYFQDEGMLYLEKNLYNQKLAISSIGSIVNLLYEKTGRANRAYLRIDLSPKAPISVNIMPKIAQVQYTVPAKIKDLSMNGMRLKFENRRHLDEFMLKGFIGLNLLFPQNHLVKIKMAIVVRIEPQLNEIGVYFEPGNPKMMNEDQANYYTASLYHWITEFVEQ